DSLYNLAGNAHDCVSAEPCGDCLAGNICREAWQRKRLVDSKLEVSICYVFYIGPTDHAHSKDPVLIRFLRLLKAIGGHYDGTGKCSEFLVLVLPCRAIVSIEVRILLEFGIGMRRQHL